jgi:hypothetical protein
MRARLAEGIVRGLVARAPRQVADFLLDFVMNLSSAQSGAVFLAGRELSLFSSSGITQTGLDWVGDCWEQSRQDLRSGSVLSREDDWLVPARHGDDLVALVYLRAAKPDYDGVVEVTPLLAEAAAQGQAAPESSPVDTYLESALQEDIERRRLVLLLRRHEWNISRVARELGVTRQTVYNRLQALGIDREPRDTTRKVQAEVLLQRSRA